MSEIPAHWEDVSTKGSPGTAYRRSDGRARVEMSAFGRWVGCVPDLVFPLEAKEGEDLPQFMSSLDDLDTPRIPRAFELPRQKPVSVTSDQVSCLNHHCCWRHNCVCHITARERTMSPDLKCRLVMPKQPLIEVTCISFKKDE